MRLLHLGDHDGDHRPRAQAAERGEAVVAVRRPVAPLLGTHRDDGIEVASQLVDRGAELGDVGFGEVALVGRGLDPVDGKAGEELPAAAEGIAIGGEDGPAIGLHRLGQPGDRGGRRARAEHVGGDPTRARRGFRPLSGAPGFLCGLRLGHGHLAGVCHPDPSLRSG